MDATLQDPLLGRMLDGRYRVEQRVAVGGMATVYRGVDVRLDRVVALKVMHPGFAADPDFVQRFIREAKAVARLSHPNVVGVYDQGEDHTSVPPAVFLAMEFVPGWTLRDLLRDRGALSPRTTLDILEPVLAALGAAHRAGLVHRDVKPENVLLTEDGRVKVADFGLVRAVNGQTAATTQQVMGTVSYLAPEQIESGAADPRSDVYACGVMLYEMLTGSKPHTGESPMQVIFQHLSVDVPPPSALVPGLAPQLDAITRAATARDASGRPADAVELLAELQRARREMTPAQLDAEPPAGHAAATGLGVGPGADVSSATALLPPPVERTSVMDPAMLRELPADLVMPRRERPEPPPVALTRRQRGVRRPRWVLPAGVVVVLALLVAGLTWALNGGLYTRMPSVLRVPQAQAVQTLEHDGFTVSLTQDFSGSVPKGTVISTNPGPGARVRKDADVSVDVSKGPQRPTVPSVAGKSVADATAALQQAGLAVSGQQQQQTSSTVPAGAVIGTSPAAGQQVAPQTVVTLVVSSGAQPVPLPDVTGETLDQATSDLQSAGFQVALNPTQIYSDQDAGTVAQMNPPAGQAAQGATITLTMSKGQQQVTVPDVTGMTEKDATKALKQAGFKVRSLGFTLFGSTTVRSETPGGNSQAAMGSTVTIWLY
ncbi:Stk1 family PASTA domain-containing Ser/Thr kinase [Streptacidiphilus fuscans]|uniref:non-specific serine/threonine protein kinase n=1 Tax=Streptacidiphilus fuscans TaxID=2789292 RepID=A0A931B8L1_9ACTN|nr:Stk1 family PASTA domain-containing Ser/Thr kinase [Streptacidiphilus fuscans]MBF9071026.1 Stk1 family PASTA domain-containing Ser/Thr kinase [Streptacidiphilus fuscans]